MVAGLLKLKGAAFETPLSEIVETTIHGLRSILLKATSIKSVINILNNSKNKNARARKLLSKCLDYSMRLIVCLLQK